MYIYKYGLGFRALDLVGLRVQGLGLWVLWDKTNIEFSRTGHIECWFGGCKGF